jgi:hypothetical protein
VTAQTLALGEAVAKEIGHQGFVVGKRHETVADVARRQHAELLLKPPGGAAVVADRHDGGEIARSVLEPAKQRREPGAAADGDDLITLLQSSAGQRVAKSFRAAPASDSNDRTNPHPKSGRDERKARYREDPR